MNGEYGAWRTLDLHGDAKYSEESFTRLLELKARLAEKAFNDTVSSNGVCGHFQWIFNSHDNPGRVQPDGALRRVDKIGPINYKGLVTTWEEPTQAYYMYKGLQVSGKGLEVSGKGLKTAADRNKELVKGAEGYHYLYRINCGGEAFTHEWLCRLRSATLLPTSAARRATSCSSSSASVVTACGTTCPSARPFSHPHSRPLPAVHPLTPPSTA